MWKSGNKILFVIILGPFIIMGTVLILASMGIDPLEIQEDGNSPISLLIGGIICIAGPSLGLGGILLFMYLQNRRIAFLFQNGIQGTAILKGIEHTGVEINNIPQFRMRLEITLPDRPPYELIHKECLNVFVTSSIKKDMEINVYVHPDKQKSIFLDWETVPDYNYPSF